MGRGHQDQAHARDHRESAQAAREQDDMNTRKKPLALLDLDGTVADFDGAMRRELAKLRAPGEDAALDESKYEDLPHMSARRRLIKNQPGFWRNLEPLALGMTIARLLKEEGCRLHVLTKGPKHAPNAWTEKFEWCQEHLPNTAVTVSHDKSMVYGKIL